MKTKIMKTKITLVVAILFSLCSFGQVGTIFVFGGINYKVTSNTTVEVAKNWDIKGNVVIPETVSYFNSPNYQVTSIGYEGFSNCTGLLSVIIPNSITSIGNNAFYSCSGLTSLAIPNSVISIGDSTFFSCSDLTSVTISNSVINIGNSAFFNCKGLKAVTINNSVTNIGASAFQLCSKLTTINIPNSLTSISENTFSGTALTSINIPASVAIIGGAAFFGCSGLTSITIPNSVASIGPSAFSNCFSLYSINIGNSVSSIGLLAFYGCSFPTVSISRSVTSIGDSAFSECKGLKAITLEWTTPLSINRNVFDSLNIDSITLNVPVGTDTAYKAANVWKEFKVETTLGTDNFSTNTPIKFYPNPTQSQINFTQEINTLEVFDIAGKKVKSFQNPSTNYDVSSLQKGVYILKGTAKNGKSVNEKLVKE